MKKRNVLFMVIMLIIALNVIGCTKTSNEVNDFEVTGEEKWILSPDNKEIRLLRNFKISSTDEEVTEDEYQKNLDSVGINEINIVKTEDEIFDETKESMIIFIKEYFDVDVSEKMNNLETYLYSKSENESDTQERGYYVPGTTKIKINRAIFDNWEKNDIQFIWAHEVFHYLGIIHDDSKQWTLYESMTAALTELFVKWAGYRVIQFDDYDIVKNLSLQMIEANPNLISDILKNPNNRIEDNINNVLKMANYPYYTLNDIKIADLLSGMMQAMVVTPDVMNYCTSQEIAVAYCRTFALDEKQKEYIEANFIIEGFDKLIVEVNQNTGYYDWYFS